MNVKQNTSNQDTYMYSMRDIEELKILATNSNSSAYICFLLSILRLYVRIFSAEFGRITIES